MNRRDLLAFPILASTLILQQKVKPCNMAAMNDSMSLVDPSNGLSVTVEDWRLFDFEDSECFIASFKNTSGQVLKSPTLGYISRLAPDDVFGWFNPYSPVLRPGETTFGVGTVDPSSKGKVVPDELQFVLCRSLEPFEDPTWNDSDVTIEIVREETRPDGHVIDVSITWLSRNLPIWPVLQVLAFDDSGRCLGGMKPIRIQIEEPGKIIDRRIWMVEGAFPSITNGTMYRVRRFTTRVLLNPFVGLPVRDNCPAVLPWNRT